MAKSFTDHPDFHRASPVASEAVIQAAKLIGDGSGLLIGPNQLDDVAAGKVVDALTRFLLRELDRARSNRADAERVAKACNDIDARRAAKS